jgi:dinuclear metal center YbgI/SA1388 family protein
VSGIEHRVEAPVDRDDLVTYLDAFLSADAGPDFCPNGLQVEGTPTIRRLVTGVSACQELFQRARKQQADAILVHHGIFWEGDPRVITGIQRTRVAELIEGNLNLIAYHLPLDRHPEVGNNAVASQRLGLSRLSPFGDYSGGNLGFSGEFDAPIPIASLLERCQSVFQQEPLCFPEGPELVATVGMISGAAEGSFREAVAAGLDAYITGEASEWVMNVARESGTHFIAAGHYATERLGVQTLGKHLAEKFGLEVCFEEIANPV